jgi:Arc/MetJ-type ribon-helix-helix transcriptional regulator
MEPITRFNQSADALRAFISSCCSRTAFSIAVIRWSRVASGIGRSLGAEAWPMNVTLTDEMKYFVQKKVESGAFPSEEADLQEAVRRFRQEDQAGGHADNGEKSTEEDLIDYDAITSCEKEADDSITLEAVRIATSKIKDSMARVVIEEERAERF